MKIIISLVIICIMTAGMDFASLKAQNAWVERGAGPAESSGLRSVIINKDILYIATKDALYKAKDIKENWQPIYSLGKSGNNEINCLACKTRLILIGTKRGLLKSDDYGSTWKNIFKTVLPDKNNITCIELSKHDPNIILIATEKGIFLSADLGNKWRDISGVLKNRDINCIALNKEAMYVVADSGLYIRRTGTEDWQKVLARDVLRDTVKDESADYTDEETEEVLTSIGCIAVNDGVTYAGFDNRIICSNDSGKTWRDFTNEGLGRGINYILISQKNKRIYCATDKGVFEFNNEKSKWLELYKGMSKSMSVSRLLFADENENTLLAVTEKGLYKFESGDYLMGTYPDIEKGIRTLKIVLDGEPTFKELREAAIQYAEVSPEKIKKWRMESRLKALLPKISVSADRNRADTYEIYTSATREYILTGPDDTSDGWNVGLSWELGDLIWSDDQTNIDVRSKLMVQLRNDILDDLRRVYYERKRLQFELMTRPPKDMNMKFEKELRLQELGQAIDDLTGNYLTERTNKVQASAEVTSGENEILN